MNSRIPLKYQSSDRHNRSIYEGSLSKTLTESVHLSMADGSIGSFEVYRVVNVATHPQLRDRVINGEIHRLEDGRELGLPFIYHDPERRKFALVIPTLLSHLELLERSKLMERLAKETSFSVPPYVSECTTVVGIEALEVFLKEPSVSDRDGLEEIPPEQKNARFNHLEQGLIRHKRTVAERERNLIAITESVTAWEEKLRIRVQQLETKQRDLVMREQQLRERLTQLEHSASDYSSPVADGEWREISSFPPTKTEFGVNAEIVPIVEVGIDDIDIDTNSFERIVQDTEIEELDAIDPHIHTQSTQNSRNRISRPPPLRLGGGVSPPPLMPRVVSPEPYSLSDDQLRVISSRKNESNIGQAMPPITQTGECSSGPISEPQVLAVPRPDVEPPLDFFSQTDSHQIKVVFDQGRPWLFVRIEEDFVETYPNNLDLLVQYVEVQQYPVVFFTLLPKDRLESHIRRTIIDPLNDRELEILHSLSQSFRAHVVTYIEEEYVETLTVEADRESVIEEILDRVAQVSSQDISDISVRDVMEEAMNAPPAVYVEDFPFGLSRSRTNKLSAILQAVNRLSQWIHQDRIREAIYIYNVPRYIIEASIQRILSAAIRCGIALSEELQKRAIELGIAKGPEDLIGRQLDAFAVKQEQEGADLTEAEIRENWQRLSDLAKEYEVAVDESIRQRAEFPDSPNELCQEELPDLGDLSTDQLFELLEEEERQSSVSLELLKRKDPVVLSEVFRVFDHLEEEEVFRLMPLVLNFGENAAEHLIAALASKNKLVRQASALSLGKLKLRRAVTPLIRQLQNEKTDIWSEIARALGEYGPIILKKITKALKNSDGTDQRYIVTLAHLANHGCAKEVSQLERDSDSRVASAARKATAQRSRIKWEDQAVRENRPLTKEGANARFSQLFYHHLVEGKGTIQAEQSC